MSALESSEIKLLQDAAKRFIEGEKSLRRLWLENPETIEAWKLACLEAEATRASEEGDHYASFDFAAMGLEMAKRCDYPPDEFERLQVLALARSGSTQKAQEILEELIQRDDKELLKFGLLARTYRDMADASVDPEERKGLFATAAEWAEKGWSRASTPVSVAGAGYYAYLANQVAQFAFLAGDHERSLRFQEVVLDTWQFVASRRTDVELDHEAVFWWETNLAEMAVLRKDLEAARRHYMAMRERGGCRMGHVTANAHVSRMLLKGIGEKADALDDCFALPPVVVFSGHMFDDAHREIPRFPVAHAERVKAKLAEALEQYHVEEGFASASAGADLLFSEALVERAARLELILPFSRKETRKYCISPYGEPWESRFEDLLKKAHKIKELEWSKASEKDGFTNAGNRDQSQHFAYANRVMLGLARLRAQKQGVKLLPIVVWDQSDAGKAKLGGAGDFVSNCFELGLEPLIIHPMSP